MESTGISPRPRFEFPFKLHSILEDAALQGKESIISWHPDGTSFKIHAKRELESEILPQYLSSPKYRSFQRQLSFYGFTFVRDPSSDHFRYYHHPLFLRGRPDLCKGTERRNQKSSPQITSSESQIFKPVEFYRSYPAPVDPVLKTMSEEYTANQAMVSMIYNSLPSFPIGDGCPLQPVQPCPTAVVEEDELLKFFTKDNIFLDRLSNHGRTPPSGPMPQNFDFGLEW